VLEPVMDFTNRSKYLFTHRPVCVIRSCTQSYAWSSLYQYDYFFASPTQVLLRIANTITSPHYNSSTSTHYQTSTSNAWSNLYQIKYF
jgi:hypothetical protein